ncbi:hypothetical protein PMAYCL1PPCAC_15259 [Pristionchus mayeri]|uniref:Uncharacterized protein n=1 Tax=Pristionchus mayeri TaxID=1317129 RepID=A0AAN5CIM1_9BILA|nr:hypothetical protein PMAYCL1PPCAC_15259 [Pristionchus mayeri]
MEDHNALAGHMPADKVGGMRVVRKDRPESQSSSTDVVSDTIKSIELRQAENVLASTGLVAQMNKNYPEAAVRHYHDKPVVPKQQVHNKIPQCPRTTGNLFRPTKNQ